MFSLFIVINHNKLLKKSGTNINDEIIEEIIPIIKKRGGIISTYSEYLSFFPSNYEYSKIDLLICLKELFAILNNKLDLVGFSLIIDNCDISSDFEYDEIKNFLFLKTTTNNNIWFSKESFKLFEGLIFSDVDDDFLVMAPKDFYKTEFKSIDINSQYINENIQDYLNLKTDSFNYFNSKLGINLYRNIIFWAKKSKSKMIYIDLSLKSDNLFMLLDCFLVSNKYFDPKKDLTKDEVSKWDLYYDLYNSFCERNYDSFVLDDAHIHYNKLILLWIEAFAKRYKLLLVINIDSEDHEIIDLCKILSLLDGVIIFLFNKNLPKEKTALILPEEPSLESSLGQSIHKYLLSKSDVSLMVLYIALITKGFILVSDILLILKSLKCDIIQIQEELKNYRRLGFLIGDNFLYTIDDHILDEIIEIKKEYTDLWKIDFLTAFLKLKFDKNFSYSYVFSLIGLNTIHHTESLKLLFKYIQKTFDLGRNVKISNFIVEQSNKDYSLKNILSYKKIREERLTQIISPVEVIKKNDKKVLFESELEYLDLSNNWSSNFDNNFMNRCKELYFTYQTKNEHLNESRVKTLFALGLLNAGSVGEAVDYFELNCTFSKDISDKYSYLRNGCFLGISLFIKGDLSGVLRITAQLLKVNSIYFKTKWLLYLKFIRARTLIEFGHYDDALILIEDGIILATNFNYADILSVYKNWKGRVYYYMGNEGKARETLLNNLNNNEAFFFLSEIEYLSGNFSKSEEYINKADFTIDDTILFDENLKWRDGFFVIEEFYNRNSRCSILKEEISNFKFLISILNGNNQIYNEFQNKILNISNDSIGLYDYKYLFYLYLAMNRINNEDYNLNRDNLINRTIRLLQQRASNISEHNQKHFYINNFFNSRIIAFFNDKKLF